MASTADRLVTAARDLMLAHPGLDPSRAYQIALDRDPALAADHYRGHVGEAVPQPEPQASTLVDPGQVIAEHAAAKGISFSAACAALPALAAAWNRGEYVAASSAPASPSSCAIVRFRAALAGLRKVAIFRAGTWNGRSYSAKDLAAMVRAFEAEHFAIPVKIGHDDRPDAPAVGRIERLWVAGDTLFADFANVAPELVDGIRDGRWLSLSCEIALNFKRNGSTYPAALLSVAVLGAHPPGVDLPALTTALAE